ncbi:MAG: hypothetical protein QW594_02270 [Candidatus Woesearchaeota archaeon]
MGASTPISHLIMFIGVLVISTAVVGVFNNYVDSTSSALTTQQQFLANQLKTAIGIEVVSYHNSTNRTIAYLENLGKTILVLDDIDLYLDNERIPRNTSNRTIELIADTEKHNLGKWDPKEKIKITIFKPLPSNTLHTLVVSTNYGGLATAEFST